MKKAILAVAAAAVIAAGTMSASTAANAGCYGCGVGAGVAGGLIAGAIIGGAIANSQPRYYAPAPGYVVYGGYGEPYPWLAQAAIGRVGRSPSTPMATRSAGAALVSSALKLRMTG